VIDMVLVGEVCLQVGGEVGVSGDQLLARRRSARIDRFQVGLQHFSHALFPCPVQLSLRLQPARRLG
jgi:hypothetical protein